jgi:prevent-host-death family protein
VPRGSAPPVANSGRGEWLGANQRLRRAIMDENGGGMGVGGMRAKHEAEARHSIFMAGTLTGQIRADILEYQASDAQAKWEELLDEVQRGGAVRITRHGKTIARLVPEPEIRREEVAEALNELRAIGREFGKAPLDEVLATIHEGHKY